jgi:restriction system protein
VGGGISWVVKRRALKRRYTRIGVLLTLIAGIATGAELHSQRAGMTVGALVFTVWLAMPLAVRAHRATTYFTSGLRDVDAMSGTEFENYVAARLRAAGYRVGLTSVTGDFGVDLIATRGEERIAIQCKRRGRSIGPAAVQEVVAGAPLHHCKSTMVVSNQEFTPAAIQLAAVHSCELVGRARLPKWARSFRPGKR